MSRKRARGPGRARPARAAAPPSPAPFMEELGALLFGFGEALVRSGLARGTVMRNGHVVASSEPNRLAMDLELFGLEQPFTALQLRDAYRRLSRAHHPDQGGSDAAMKRLNAAHARLEPLAGQR